MDFFKLLEKYTENPPFHNLQIIERLLFEHLNEDSGEPDGSKGFLRALREKKTNLERVTLVHEKLDKYDLITDKFHNDYKTDAEARDYREKGNKYFAANKYDKALKSYTKIIMIAKDPELLVIGYGNRSAALFKLELYEECLKDIERALTGDYPEKNKVKLIDRRKKATELLEKGKCRQHCYDEVPKIPTSQKNPSIQYASKSIEIGNDKKHKYIVAARNIDVGDILLVEPCLAATIDEVYFYHCHHCFTLCYNPIPCDTCTQTIYCGEVCKNNAYTYHKDECPILFAFWMLFEKSYTLMLALKMTLCLQNRKDEIHKLVEGINLDITSQLSRDGLVGITVCAALTYDYVKKFTQRFSGVKGRAAADFFKEYIVTCILLCTHRAVPIEELSPGDEKTLGIMRKQAVAHAIYPLYSLFRHACCPNVVGHSYGVKRVVRAIRSIKKGEECLVSYGIHYTSFTKEERQDRLWTAFSFKCTCQACTENWLQLTSTNTKDIRLFFLKLQNADVEQVKRIASEKVRKVKELEKFEPRYDLTYQNKILLFCWDILGNKRLIR